eukprot:8493859-Pyramimonas_sp.AAC.1
MAAPAAASMAASRVRRDSDRSPMLGCCGFISLVVTARHIFRMQCGKVHNLCPGVQYQGPDTYPVAKKWRPVSEHRGNGRRFVLSCPSCGPISL